MLADCLSKNFASLEKNYCIIKWSTFHKGLVYSIVRRINFLCFKLFNRILIFVYPGTHYLFTRIYLMKCFLLYSTKTDTGTQDSYFHFSIFSFLTKTKINLIKGRDISEFCPQFFPAADSETAFYVKMSVQYTLYSSTCSIL